MPMQVVGVSPETGEAIRSRVRNLEELKVAETKINVINIIILMIIIMMMKIFTMINIIILIIIIIMKHPDDDAQEKTECELQRVLLMAGHLSPALRREDLR